MIGALVLLVIATAGVYYRFVARSETIDSVAVLPFLNVGGDPNAEYLSDGITESLINSLSQLPKLRVMSRDSAFRYKGKDNDAQAVGRELGIRAVFKGRVAQRGDTLAISAELIDAQNNSHIWGQQYSRKATDIFSLQDDIAKEMTTALRLRLTGKDEKQMAKGHTADPEAYQDYLRGRYFWTKRTPDSLDKAIGYFQQAIDRDPAYAAAYSGLADCYSSLGFSFDVGSMAPNDVQPKALAAVRKAIALDDSLSEAHSSLAFINLNYDWDWRGSETEFKRGIDLNPGWANGHHWYAHNLISAGRLQEAEAQSKRALELDTLSPIMNVHLGWHYYFARQYDKSLEQLQKTLELDSNYGLAYWYRGWDYEQKHMYADALREMRKAKELLKGNLVVDSDIAHVYAASGDYAGAEKVIAELKEVSSRRYVNPFEIALIYVGLGQKQQAFEWLERAYRERSDMLVYLKVDPRLDPLRSDPRFADLLRRMNLSP